MQVRLITREKQYQVGENASGHVRLLLEKSTMIQKILLQVRCLQKVELKGHGLVKTRKGKYIVCQTTSLLPKPSLLSEGLHLYDFSPRLHESLPASLEMNKVKSKATIKYELRAEVKHSNGETTLTTLGIDMRPHIPKERMEPQIFSIRKPIRKYGMISKGLCEIIVTLDRTHFCVSEPLRIKTLVRNESLYDIVSLQFQIQQFVQVRLTENDDAVFQQRQDQQVLYKSDDWVSVPIEGETMHMKDLKIPTKDCVETTKSKLISCQHFLMVQLKGASSSNQLLSVVKVDIPLQLSTSIPTVNINPAELRIAEAKKTIPRFRLLLPSGDDNRYPSTLRMLKN